MDYPADLLSFLDQGGHLQYDPRNCEAGLVKLVSSNDLCAESVGFSGAAVSDLEPDPNEGRDGEYEGLAVNLVEECEDHEGIYLLCWFPQIGLYGSYNEEEAVGLVFPNENWSTIVADPIRFLEASWLDDEELEQRGRFVIPILPWRYFPWVE